MQCQEIDTSAKCQTATLTRSYRIRGVALAILLCLAVGCGTPASSVLIDNTSTSPMVVKVDGKTVAKVPGQEQQRISLLPGRYEVEVKSNGREVFKGIRIIQENDSVFADNYLFNPLSNRGYALCKVVYGSSAFSDMTDSAIVALAEYKTGQKVDKTKHEYLQVKRYATPMSSSCWFQIPRETSYVLRDAPESVYSRTGSTSKRVLTRISKDDLARLKKYHKIDNPTAEDVVKLKSVTTRALDSMAMLEPW